VGKDVKDGTHASREAKPGEFRVVARELIVVVSRRAVMMMRASRRYVDIRVRTTGFVGKEGGVGNERR